METIGFTCKNCGFPLNVPDGAESVACPSCRGTNSVQKSVGEIHSGALTAIDSKMDSVVTNYQALSSTLDVNSKIQLKLYEVQSAKDDYMKTFLPEKERAGIKLNNELDNFDRQNPVKKSGMGCLIFMILGLGFALTKASAQEAGFFVILEVVCLVILAVRLAGNARRKSNRAKKKQELTEMWDKWNRDEEAHKAKIAALEKELREIRGEPASTMQG